MVSECTPDSLIIEILGVPRVPSRIVTAHSIVRSRSLIDSNPLSFIQVEKSCTVKTDALALLSIELNLIGVSLFLLLYKETPSNALWHKA